MRFVIADDSNITRAKIHQFLRSGGHDVVAQAEDGRELIGLCRIHRPDAVITDLNMPVMTGNEAVAVILDEALVPFVFTLSLNKQEAVLEPLIARGVRVLKKPIYCQPLLDAIAEATQ